MRYRKTLIAITAFTIGYFTNGFVNKYYNNLNPFNTKTQETTIIKTEEVGAYYDNNGVKDSLEIVVNNPEPGKENKGGNSWYKSAWGWLKNGGTEPDYKTETEDRIINSINNTLKRDASGQEDPNKIRK